ncbi:MAG: ATP-binding protein, partial [Chromatiaceae bacterium]
GNVAAYGLPPAEQERREALAADLHGILARNRLVDTGTRYDTGDRQPVSGGGEAATRDAHEPAMPLPPQAESEGSLTSLADQAVEMTARPGSAPAPQANVPVPAQAGFDRLESAGEQRAPEGATERKKQLAKVEDLNLDMAYQRKSEDAKRGADFAPDKQLAKERAQRRERGLLPEPLYPAPSASPSRESAPPSAGAEAPRGQVSPPPPSTPGTGSRASLGTPSEEPAESGRVLDPDTAQDSPTIRIRIFESELDPFEMSLLESGHFVLYRKVWRGGQRFIQGALLERDAFLRGLVEEAYRSTSLSRISDLSIAYRGTVLSVLGARTGRDYLSSVEGLSGALLYRGRLSAPAGDLELVFSADRLPAGPGGRVVGWLAAILALVLTGGFYALYRLGLRQIALTRQQQDFVSSVSHELKTPLTSIRMYGDMLREGWVTDERRRTYYDFICSESERLTRLINNVLQLARLTRNELTVELTPTPVGVLMHGIAPRLVSQVESVGFKLDLDCRAAEALVVRVDADFLSQILINLVDNGIKFSRNAERKEIQIRCVPEANKELRLSVRDHGPGIPQDQRKKIFLLFYRPGNALTRDTMGTGIGLALVRQLAQAMNGRVDVVNAEPGAEFRVYLPIQPGLPG